MCTWNKQAWDDMSPDTIKKSFKKCSVSNSLDGSEDHLICEDEGDFLRTYLMRNWMAYLTMTAWTWMTELILSSVVIILLMI